MSYEEITTPCENKNHFPNLEFLQYSIPPTKRQRVSDTSTSISDSLIVAAAEISRKITLQHLQQLNPDEETFSRKKRYSILVNSIKYCVFPPYTIRKYHNKNTNNIFWYAISLENKEYGGTGSVKKIAILDPQKPFDEQDFDYNFKEKTYKISSSDEHYISLFQAFSRSCNYENRILKNSIQTKIDEKQQAATTIWKCRIVSLWHSGTSLQNLINRKTFFNADLSTLYNLLLSTAKILSEMNRTAVHLDVKPGNILVNNGRAYMLIDGDTYFELSNDLSKIGTLRTTSTYFAPELKIPSLLDTPMDKNSLLKFDAFALGITFLVVVGFSEEEVTELKKKVIENHSTRETNYSLVSAISIRNKILQNFQVTIEAATALGKVVECLIMVKPDYRSTAKESYNALCYMDEALFNNFSVIEKNLPSPTLNPIVIA